MTKAEGSASVPAIGDVRGWAFGLLHLSRADFYEMRPGEFWEAWGAYLSEKNADRKHAGELARGIALRLFNIQLRKGDQIKDPSRFWRMPWDEDQDENERIVNELNALTDEERGQKAMELLRKVGWCNGRTER